MRIRRSWVVYFLCSWLLSVDSAATLASGHAEAPLIAQDPQADITDVYAFIGTKYDDPGKVVLNVIVQVLPFSEAGAGAIYDRFADDALYGIHIADPNTGRTVLRYDFRFSSSTSGYKNRNTALSYGLGTGTGAIASVGDAQQNYVQTYNVTKVISATSVVTTTRIGTGLLTPPPNVGKRVTPLYNDPTSGKAISGAVDAVSLDGYTQQTVHRLSSGEVVFAGPREDGFFADLSGLFDIFDPRILDNNGDFSDGLGQDGGGVDLFKSYNVLVFAIQIPVETLPSFAYTAPFADLDQPLPAFGPAKGVGVYASVRRMESTRRINGAPPVHSGLWIQVSRMGNPLFNQLLVAVKDKDAYNLRAPTTDRTLFINYALNSEIASLINYLLSVNIPATNRTDLAAIFIPDLLRVDTTTPPVSLPGESSFSRFGFLGGDTTTDRSGRRKSSGWPNGRRLGDDVVDIALSAIVSGPGYSSIIVLGDNVAANDQLYNRVFPYAGTPHAGTTSRLEP